MSTLNISISGDIIIISSKNEHKVQKQMDMTHYIEFTSIVMSYNLDSLLCVKKKKHPTINTFYASHDKEILDCFCTILWFIQ